MDWTGGTRRRFTGGKNNSTIQKQKAYFAKTRAALHATPSSRRSFTTSNLRQDWNSAWSKVSNRAIAVSRPQRTGHVSPRNGSGFQSSAHRRSSRRNNDSDKKPIERVGHLAPRQGGALKVQISIGSRASSSAVSSRSSALKPGHCKQDGATPSRGTMTDEGKLLLARRRHLLSKGDWLGLTVARPAQVTFPSSQDKEHIGKRRRIKKPVRRNHMDEERKMIPFEQRPGTRDYMMSGALISDNIQVKIGTDALATQTQMSHRSRTPAHTSMRHLSTNISSLSEESMLLGEEGDAFENLVNAPYHRRDDNFDLDEHGIPVILATEAIVYEQHIPDHARMERTIYNSDFDRIPAGNSGWPTFRGSLSSASRVPDSTERHYCIRAPSCRGLLDCDVVEKQENRVSEYHTVIQHLEVSSEVAERSRSPHDEELWKNFVNITAQPSSHTSMAAVQSDSLHLSNSESQDPRVSPVQYLYNEDIGRPLSTPKGAGTQGSILRCPQETVTDSDQIERPTEVHSAPIWLHSITTLAKQPPLPDARKQEAHNDDELWRSFIIGSRSTSHQSSPRSSTKDIVARSVELSKSPSPVSASAVVSGLGTSNQSTAGHTLGALNRTSSTTGVSYFRQGRHGRGRRQHSEYGNEVADAQNNLPNDNSLATNLFQASTSQNPKNIHANATSILDPRRFKRPETQKPTTRGVAKNRAARRATRKLTSKTHSVYDLVDSDDKSIA